LVILQSQNKWAAVSLRVQNELVLPISRYLDDILLRLW